MTSISDAEGNVVLPRRMPLLVGLGFLATFAGQVFWVGTYTATIDNRLTALVDSDCSSRPDPTKCRRC